MTTSQRIAGNKHWTHLYVLRPDSAHARDAQDKTYCVEDVRFPTAVEAGDRIKALIPTADDRTHSIRFEAVNDDFYDPHIGGVVGGDSIGNASSVIDAGVNNQYKSWR